MNQAKRTKGRGSGGFNRARNRGPNTPHSHSFINSQNDDLKPSSVDIYQNPCLVHSIISLLGCLVEVTVPNGTVYEGVLKTVSPTLDVTLEVAHKTHKKSGQQKIEEYVPVPSKECLIETLVIGLKNIVCIAAKDVDLEEIKKADNFTDTAISSRVNGQAGHERPLQKWEDPSGDHEEITGILEDSTMKNGLDPIEMFATNEKEHGVTSSYDHNMLCYTTPVEGSKELEDKAELLAREIEQENNYSDRNEVDSGKTEEELFSAVVRDSPAQGRPKVQGAGSRDETRRDAAVPAKDLPTVSPPKPQRVPRERDTRLADSTSRPTAVTEQVKSLSRDTVSNSISTDHEPKTESSTAKPEPKPQVVSSAAKNLDNKPSKRKTPKEETKERQTENVKDNLEELKSFSTNFKLAGTEEANPEQLKKEPSATTSTQQPNPAPKEQALSSTSEEEPPQQRDSPKVQEQQRSTETPPKTTEKQTTSKLNPDAPVFKPGSRTVQRTPPVTPQQQFISAVVASPTPVRPGYPPLSQVTYNIRQPHQMKGPPRSPYNPSGPRFFPGRDPADPHGSPGMSAAAATGNPIIAQGGYPYIAVQPSQFHTGMLQQIPPQGSFVLHPGPQGTQQHYVVPHSVSNAPVQSMAQSYQENLPVYAAGTIPMAPSSPFQGSPQPSPTTQGQFLQYLPPTVMQQQQGSQPPIAQAVLASPNQHPHVLMMQQQGGPQPMTAIPGSPGNPMMQFMPGQVGYPRKPQPHQWAHQQHP